jgi:hypothetical protein
MKYTKIYKRTQKYNETQLLLLNKIENNCTTQTRKMGYLIYKTKEMLAMLHLQEALPHTPLHA